MGAGSNVLLRNRARKVGSNPSFSILKRNAPLGHDARRDAKRLFQREPDLAQRKAVNYKITFHGLNVYMRLAKNDHLCFS